MNIKTMCVFTMALSLAIHRSSSMAELVVLSSIKPVNLLVQAIGGQHVSSHYLVPAGVSPHTFSLKPSDRMQLQQADVLFWVGPELEFYLEKVLAGSADKQSRLRKAVALGGDESAKNDFQPQAGHTVRAHDTAEHSGHTEHTGSDPHQWLDPLGALSWAEQITATLVEQDPDNQHAYRQALLELRRQLLDLDARLQQRFSKVQDRGFVVMHDAYSYFVQRYHLRQLAVYTPTPERTPSARHIAELQSLTSSGEVVCLFAEVQAQAKGFAMLSGSGAIKVAELDLMGAGITEGPRGYIDFIEAFAASISDCLLSAP